MVQAGSRRKRLAVIATATALVVGGGGAAFAYWTSTGSGAGAALTSSHVVFTVASSAATGDALSPGSGTQTVAFTVTNPGPSIQSLTSVDVTVATATGTEWTAGACSAADYKIGAIVIDSGQIGVGSKKDGTVEISMNDTGVNQDDCQGKPVPLYIVAK